MSKLTLKNGISRKPHYSMTLSLETMDLNDETTLELEFDKNTVDTNYNEFIEFLKFLYVCHYTSDNTKGCLEGFYHVKEYSDFVGDYRFKDEDPKSIFSIDIPECRDEDCNYRFNHINLKYIDDKIYDVSIDFDEKDILDIVNKIEKYHTIEYGWCFGKFSDNDDPRFKQTYDKMNKPKRKSTKKKN